MSVLRNLEAKLEGLVEGTFSRAFKSKVQPVELAHKLAKEMEDSKTVSLSRVYVPNEYVVFLSPKDREQFEGYESALQKELSDYLLEHARKEGLTLVTRPSVGFKTDERLGLGEFGIQAQLVHAEEDGEPEQGDFGNTMVYSPDRAPRPLVPPVSSSRKAFLVGGGKRVVVSGSHFVIGRSREADMVVDDPNVSRRHAELRPEQDGWIVRDLGSTNGIQVNGRHVAETALAPGDEITLGLTKLTFELD